tara:strand:- start:767 stop:1192 length:426 start_codon:yes stop_codon:yes gene_type:complete
MLKILFSIILLCFTLNCTDRTIYSGKILNQDNFTNINFKDKKSLLDNLGSPSFIDPITNKYFYYSEKEKRKSAFSKKINYSLVFVFEFDDNNFIKNSKVYDLTKKDNVKIIDDITENEIVKRGLLEKVFGGVGPQPEIPQQ